MRSNRKTFSRFAGSALALTLSAMEILAQSTRVKEAEVISRSGDQWVYTIIFIVLSGLGLAAYLWTRSRKSIGKTNDNFENRETSYFNSGDYEMNDVDAAKELEWLRKTKRSSNGSKKASSEPEQPAQEQLWRGRSRPVHVPAPEIQAYQDKMKMLQYAQLPINSFSELTRARSYEPLQESNAKNLLDAIDQANVEFEPDELVRDMAIKVLSAFRTAQVRTPVSSAS